MLELPNGLTRKPTNQNLKLYNGQDLKSINKANLLRNPRHFPQNKEPLLDNFLENLIQKNIISKNNHSLDMTDHYAIRGQMIASEVRALINSLSEAHKTKLTEVIKALEPDKEMLKGAIFSGGEIRVISEGGTAIVINAIAELLGIVFSKENQKPTFNSFSGSSAGSFPAVGMAFRSLNSSILKTCSDTDFTSFFNAPDALKTWVEKFMKRGYYLATGKRADNITGKHLKEVGADLQVLVGEFERRLVLYPKMYLLPKELESRFGKDPDDFKIKDLIQASANLPILFYPLMDLFKTCGDCYIQDEKGKKHYLFDPGVIAKYLTPINLQLDEIKNYKDGKIDKPGLYFIVTNKKCKETGTPATMFGKPTNKLFYWIYSKTLAACDLLDKYILGDSPQMLKALGTQRALLTAYCEATDPFTGKLVRLGLGAFNVSTEERETLICANIPTSDFKDLPYEGVLDQLHRQLVDPLFIQSEGKQGKSAYQLFKDDIDKAIGKAPSKPELPPQIYSQNTFFIKRLANKILRSAAIFG